MKYEILVVEDDPALLEAALLTLSSEPNLELRGVSSLGEAKALLENEPPDLLVTDLRLGNEDAIDLIRDVEDRGLGIPIIVTTAFRSSYAEQLTSRPQLTILEKPVPIARLRALVRARLAEASGTGSLSSPFRLTDYVQLARLSRRSVVFDIHLEGGENGSLEIVDGQIWNARLGETSGEDAAVKLFRSDFKRMSYGPLEVLPSSRGLEVGTEELLLRLARELDEEERTDFEPSSASPFPLNESFGPKEQLACRQMVEELEGALAAFVFDIDQKALLGLQPKSSARWALQSIHTVLETLATTQSGSASDDREWIEEILLTSTEHRVHCRRSSSLVLGILGDPTVRPGLLWVALRRAFSALGRGAALVTRWPETADAEDRHVHFDLRPDLNEACREIVNGVPGGRYCGLLDSASETLLGMSHPKGAEITDALTQRGLTFVSSPDKGFARVRELTFSTNRFRRFFVRVPGTTNVVAMTTGLVTQSGLAVVALRSALPNLKKLL